MGVRLLVDANMHALKKVWCVVVSDTSTTVVHINMQVGPTQRWLCIVGIYALCGGDVHDVFDASHSVPCISMLGSR